MYIRAYGLALFSSSLFVEYVIASGKYKWLSPVYTDFFQHPLPFPPDKPVK